MTFLKLLQHGMGLTQQYQYMWLHTQKLRGSADTVGNFQLRRST